MLLRMVYCRKQKGAVLLGTPYKQPCVSSLCPAGARRGMRYDDCAMMRYQERYQEQQVHCQGTGTRCRSCHTHWSALPASRPS